MSEAVPSASAIQRRVSMLLIRHGETDENARQIIQGHMDTSLNANGVFQAEITRDYLKAKGVKPDVCWSSPLKRARRTAEIIVDGSCPIIEDERMKEKYLGALEGTIYYQGTPAQRKTVEPSHHFVDRLLKHFDSLFPAKHGQSSALEPHYGKAGEELTILDVSHGGTIKVLAAALAKQRNIAWDPRTLELAEQQQYKVNNCSITTISMQEHRRTGDNAGAPRWAGTITNYASVKHFELAQLRLKENTEADAAQTQDEMSEQTQSPAVKG